MARSHSMLGIIIAVAVLIVFPLAHAVSAGISVGASPSVSGNQLQGSNTYTQLSIGTDGVRTYVYAGDMQIFASTDAATAIQYAIDHIQNGGSIYIGPGTYIITTKNLRHTQGSLTGKASIMYASIFVDGKKNITIEGAGPAKTVLKLAPNIYVNLGDNWQVNTYAMIYAHNYKNLTIKNMTLDGSGSSQTMSYHDGMALLLTGGYRSGLHLENLVVRNSKWDGIYLGFNSGGWERNGTVENIVFENISRDALHLDTIQDMVIKHITVKGKCEHGIWIEGAPAGHISNSLIEDVNIENGEFYAHKIGYITIRDLNVYWPGSENWLGAIHIEYTPYEAMYTKGIAKIYAPYYLENIHVYAPNGPALRILGATKVYVNNAEIKGKTGIYSHSGDLSPGILYVNNAQISGSDDGINVGSGEVYVSNSTVSGNTHAISVWNKNGYVQLCNVTLHGDEYTINGGKIVELCPAYQEPKMEDPLIPYLEKALRSVRSERNGPNTWVVDATKILQETGHNVSKALVYGTYRISAWEKFSDDPNTDKAMFGPWRQVQLWSEGQDYVKVSLDPSRDPSIPQQYAGTYYVRVPAKLIIFQEQQQTATSDWKVHIQLPFKYTYNIQGDKLNLKVYVPMDKFCSVDALASRVGDNRFTIKFIARTPTVLPPTGPTEQPPERTCNPPGGTKTLEFTLSLDPQYTDVYVSGTVAPILGGAAPEPPAPPVKPINSNIAELVKVKLLGGMNGKYRFDYTVTLPEGAVLNHIAFYCDGQEVFESQDTHGSFQTDSLCTLRAELEYREGGEEKEIEGTVFSPSAGKPECLAIDANLFRYRFELSNCEKMYGSSSEQCQELQKKVADLEEKAKNMGCGNVQIGVSGQEGCSGAIVGEKTVQVGQWTVHLDAKIPTAITAEGKTLKVTVCPAEMLRNTCQSVTAFMEQVGDDHYKILVRYTLEAPTERVCAQVMRPPKPKSFTITPKGADVYIEVEKEIGRAPLPIKEELNVEELKKMLENCIKGKCTIPQPKLPEINTKDQENAVPKGLEIAEKLAEQMKHISEHIVVKNVNVKQEGNTIVMQVQAEIQKRLFGLIPVHIPAVVEAEDNHVKTEMPWWGRLLSILSW